jgi:hypothetical protein
MEVSNMNKPKCKLTGQNGNIYNIMAIVTKTLGPDMVSESGEMVRRIVETAKSYEDALNIISEYVEVE